MRHLIALGHYSRTGKNAFAEILQRKLGGPNVCEIISFAGPLKHVCHYLFDWAGVREAEFYDTPEGILKRNEILPMLGLTPVELWIKVGTPIIRQQLHDLTWIMKAKKLINEILAQRNKWVILTDLRFPNEIDAILHEDGVVARVLRPGVNPRDSVADLALIDFKRWDFTINNNGTLIDLERAADFFLAELHRANGSNITIDASPVNCYGLKEMLAHELVR
jgi:hypothetical protein